jgi:protocatechuate 3,4-dioxygenase beta subunit
MSFDLIYNRRRVVAGLVAVTTLAVTSSASAPLLLTPRQNEGPYYPVKIPLGHDNDLVQVAGRAKRAVGEIVHLFGRVLDINGKPVKGATVEIWQCDAQGCYHHPDEGRGTADPNFQGFGSTVADQSGAWRFRTIKPVNYPGRVPHIHFRITGKGFPRLTTQMYLREHADNDGDYLFTGIQTEAERQSVLVAFAPTKGVDGPTGKFDIVIGGNARAE